MTNIKKFLSDLKTLDIDVWVENNSLRCNAPKGVLTPELRNQLAELKTEIIDYLNQAQNNGNFYHELNTITKVSREQSLPLSFGQERLWFVEQLEGNRAIYNELLSIKLDGVLNFKALEDALNTIVKRHEVLHTNFEVKDGSPVLKILSEFQLKLPIVNLEDIPSEQQIKIIEQLATEEEKHPFDFTKDILLRGKLVKLKETCHLFFLNIPHLASDGWSLQILVKELTTLYKAFSDGCPSPLPELNIQYADFAYWQRERLQGKFLEEQLKYWQKQLAGAPNLLELSTDKPRPPIQTFNGNTYIFQINKEITEQLKKLSQKYGVTLFMTLLTAFAILLSRYSGQSDLVVGSMVANRNLPELESLIGFFANVLPLRIQIKDNPSFSDLIQTSRKITLDAFNHQEIPIEKLIAELNLERNLSHNPLFQVMFILQNTPKQELTVGDVKFNPWEINSVVSRFDFSWEITETEQGLRGVIKYNTDLFAAETIQRMTRHFQTLLEGIVANPEEKVSQLPLLTPEEKQQILVEWNNTNKDYPRDKCIHQLFEEQVERTPDAVAVKFEEQQLTYRELNNKANQLGHHLQKLGVKPETLVGISLEPSLDMVVALLGIIKAGGAYVPFDPKYPPDRLEFMVKDAKVPFFLTKESLLSHIPPSNALIVYLDQDREAIDQESKANLENKTTVDNSLSAIYTSGSTGQPKAVVGRIFGLINRLHWMWQTVPFSSEEICVQKTSLNFVDHLAEIFGPLLKGVSLVIVPDEIRSDVPRLVNLLFENKITRIVLVPSLLKSMLELEPQQLLKLRELKYVFCSGEFLSLSLAKTFCEKIGSVRLFNLYGSSEVAADVTCFEVNLQETLHQILGYFQPKIGDDFENKNVLQSHRQPFTKPGVSLEVLREKFQRSQLNLYPITIEEYYEKFSEEILPYVINTGSPTYIGHMTSALPDFMHDLSKLISELNQNLVKIETSKSLIFLERQAIAMLHRLFYGFPNEFYEDNIQQTNRNLGLVTTGGTTSNISALLCARNKGLLRKENSEELSSDSIYKVLKKKGYEDIVIIGSQLMHYSFQKAASMLGLGTNNIVFIEQNEDGTLNLNLLKEQISQYRKEKLYILALVGIAGTTETGEIDPLSELGDIAQELGIHFHVDAAWGGATMFSEKYREKLRGIDKADSITICGHKQLYLPQGISVCLFKDPKLLNFVQTTARYQAQRDTFDVGRFSIEGSRSALSLCLHAALHVIGQRGYEVLINNGIDKAQYFAKLIQLFESFELMIQPSLNIVNYRYIPEDLRTKVAKKTLSDFENQRINRLNTQIQKEQFERAISFVSKTTLLNTAYGQGKEIVVFRAVISNPNTTIKDLHFVLEDQLIIANQIQARNQEKFDSVAISKIDSVNRASSILNQKRISLPLSEDTNGDLNQIFPEYLKKKTVPIGKPIANTRIYILDQHGNLTPLGVIGELYVGGCGLAKEYLNRPLLTQEKFISHLFKLEKVNNNQLREERLYKTGDLARWLPDGNIELIGRIDYQVKIRGFRIELEEVQVILAEHNLVQEAVVMASENSLGEKRLVAYLVAAGKNSLKVSELRQFLAKKLPDYMIPAAFVFLEKIPLNPNGKIDRNALPNPEESSLESKGNYVSPRTPTEEILVNIWASILGVKRVGINDNFFELGGHSLLAIRLLAQVEKIFSIHLPLMTFFQAATVEELAKILELESKIFWSYLVPMNPGGSKPPFFAIHDGLGEVFLYRNLVSCLGTDQPFYGLQAKGLDGKQLPHNRLEDMAASYIQEMQKIQPSGPYYFGGFCLGGFVAFEVVRQLEAKGEKVALAVLMDTEFPSETPKTISVRIKNFSRLTTKDKFIRIFRRIRGIINESSAKILITLIQFYQKYQLPMPPFLKKMSIYYRNVLAYQTAIENYQPEVCSSNITLLNTYDYDSSRVPDYHQRWSELTTGQLKHYVVKGEHNRVFEEPYVQELAEKLKYCLEIAQEIFN